MNLKHLGQIADSNENSETPLFSEYVQVGWPSPADAVSYTHLTLPTTPYV